MAEAGDLRSSILAELSSVKAEPAAEEKPAESAVQEATEEATGDEAADIDVEASTDDEQPVDTDAEVEAAPDDDVEIADDPKVAKGLDRVRQAEKRMREQHERREAEFLVREQKLEQRLARAEEIEALGKRAKFNPTAILRAFGVEPDDFELIAQAIYAESPALQSDPKQKAAAVAKLKERERLEEIEAVKRENAEIRKMIEQRDRDAKMREEAASYANQVEANAAKLPLVAQYLKADPEGTHDQLVRVYESLGKKLQRQPKPAEVVTAFDKAERSRLQKLGIDPNTIVKAAPKKPVIKIEQKPADKPANSNDPAKPTNGKHKMTPDEERQAILDEIAAARSAQA